MSKAHELFAAIKQLFSSSEVQFTVHKLSEGGEISVDKLEVGGSVTVSGVPSSGGEYTLEDKTVVRVDTAGLITEVVAPVETTVAVMDMTTPEGMRKAYEEMVAAFDTRIKNLETLYAEALQVNKLKSAEIDAVTTNHTEMMGKMIQLIGEVVGAPQADPPEGGKKKFSFSHVETKNKALLKYQEAVARLDEERKEKLKAVV